MAIDNALLIEDLVGGNLSILRVADTGLGLIVELRHLLEAIVGALELVGHVTGAGLKILLEGQLRERIIGAAGLLRIALTAFVPDIVIIAAVTGLAGIVGISGHGPSPLSARPGPGEGSQGPGQVPPMVRSRTAPGWPRRMAPGGDTLPVS